MRNCDRRNSLLVDSNDLIRFLNINQPVAVAVDASKIFASAQEFTTRHKTVAIAIHFSEPERTARRTRNRRIHSELRQREIDE